MTEKGKVAMRSAASHGSGVSPKGTPSRWVGVIMAGGSGERFWPLSRRLRPKQLLPLTAADQTMLGEAVARISPVIPSENVYVVTGRHLVEPIRRAQVGIPDANVIGEPAKRNTSGALAYATAVLLANYGGDGSDWSMAVLTADHIIEQPHVFRQTVCAALRAAEQHNALATMGIVPTRPETGYGYIEARKNGAPLPGTESGIQVWPVAAFHEKPSREVAEGFIATDRYFWNSGMFFWRTSTFLQELQRARPKLAQATRDMAQALRAGRLEEARAIFTALEDLSIDYALMERAKHIVVVRATFPWDDIGTWSSLDRTHPHDGHGNVVAGDPVLVDTHDCIVYSEPGAEAMAVGVVGLRGMVVVVTRDAVLVVPKDRAQDVRLAVEELKKRDAPQL